MPNQWSRAPRRRHRLPVSLTEAEYHRTATRARELSTDAKPVSAADVLRTSGVPGGPDMEANRGKVP